jgi:murein tripeptide amidase MpaA
MINVDGVIYGNFRCDLAGFDLNRNWANPNKNLHPQIFVIKGEIERIEN